MATAATIKKNIAKLEAALKSKATPKSLKPKLEAQLVKSKAELSGMNKGTKPKTSSTKSTQTALQKLKEMVNKNKKYKTYKGTGVDLERDADRPAKPIGRRTAKESGKTYYEYRANRIDVKQPPKKYPKLEKGGYMAKGGEMTEELYKVVGKKNGQLVDISELPMSKHDANKFIKEQAIEKYYTNVDVIRYRGNKMRYRGNKMAKGGISEKPIAAIMDKYGNIKSEKKLQQDLEYLKEAYENKLVTKAEYDKSYDEIKEQLKFLQKKEKGGYMADGGETADSSRMYNFLKDDLAELENAIEENNQEEIDKFFSYWNYHLSSLEPKTGSKRMYEFLKDDLVGLEAATKELPSSKEETERFFSYWNTHLSSLEPKKMAKGGYFAKGGGFNQYGEPYGFEEETDSVYEIHHKPKMNPNNPYLIWDKIDGVYVAEFPNRQRALHFIDYKKYGYAKGGYFAEGGISEKEVVESNAEMVLSQIKAVKHHAMELSNVVSKNSDIEAWVVAKIERASTDLSDITHYLEYQTNKMEMGGEIHRNEQ
jgi:hypothetical protein